jgi:hypothetical protein
MGAGRVYGGQVRHLLSPLGEISKKKANSLYQYYGQKLMTFKLVLVSPEYSRTITKNSLNRPKRIQWNLELRTQSVLRDDSTFDLNFPI